LNVVFDPLNHFFSLATERRRTSVNFGFNSNVRVGAALYHVQTEDRGPSHPFLDTVVYEAGRVVYKLSTSYQDFLNSATPEGLEQQLHARLAHQHNEVIAGLEAGTLQLNSHAGLHPKQPASVAESPNIVSVAAGEKLDVQLKNPSTWLATGRATLEIELRLKNSSKPIGNADVEAFLQRENERTPCARARADAMGHVALRFSMPPSASDGTALVIRATDGSLYGELRFQLKAKPRSAAPVSK
jgi:hypothetical protein